MGSPPLFQRSPRLHPDLPGGEVEIPSPGARPTPPSISPLSLLLSVLPGLLGPLVMLAFTRSAPGAQRPSYLLVSLPMVLLGAAVQGVNFWLQKRRYQRAVAEREEAYAALLREKEQELLGLRATHLAILQGANPAPAALPARVAERHARLWERSPADADFLDLRVGIGQVPSSVKVKVPRQDQALNPDPLYGKAFALAAAFDRVPEAPICLPLRTVEAAGLVGPRHAVCGAARNLALQLTAHHSPDEVKLVALFPEAEAEEWAWLRWLPHVHADDGTGRRYLAADRAGARRLLADLYGLLTQRKHQEGAAPLPVFVILLADPTLTENEPALPLILREGARLGAYPIVLADRQEELPQACRGIVEVKRGQLTLTAPRLTQMAFVPDSAGVTQADAVARSMAPIDLQRLASAAEIPQRVTLLELLGIRRVEALDLPARWAASEPERTLAVPIGLRAGGEPLLLDLHDKAHGPHGLVAGATGAGKSELLQTLMASLAVNYHPHEVAFVMVDFKGGGTANVFRGLPHLIGTMTNLEDGNLAQRALDALKAELKRRQRVLGAAGVNHINEYIRLRRRGAQFDPLPHLLIVADEFAELKQAQPEFMRELVSAVRVGRSLGVHLILATQKPAGVVDDQIWSNTRFRLCLRVERPEDSRDVLKCADAASLKTAGRAYCQVGNNELFELFQAAWGGAAYAPDEGIGERPVVEEVGLSGERYPLTARSGGVAETGVNQLQALIRQLQWQAEQAGIQPLESPWLPPLPTYLPLDEVQGRGGWLEPVVGLLDDPEHQLQTSLRLPLTEGHLAIYGAPGTGKTTFLQTLVLSLAQAHTPAEVHIYLIDGSGRALTALAGLPHVGGVVLADEAERAQRLLRWLAAELERRKEAFAGVGVSTLPAYRTASGVSMPAVVVGIDNYPAFAAALPECEEMLAQVAREGGSLGVHLALTAGTPAAVRSKISSNLGLAVALQLAERGEYSTAVGRTGGREPTPVPGRGLVKGSPPLEFQTALPVTGEAEWDRSLALRNLIAAMNAAWEGVRPPPVRVLPEVVHLADILDGVTFAPVGLDVESLAPFGPPLADGPHFVITGPTEGGKTTLLMTWLLSLTCAVPGLALWIVDLGGGPFGPLRGLPQVRGVATDGAQLVEALGAIEQEVAARRRALAADAADGGFAPLVLAIHDYDGFRDGVPTGTKERLEALIRRERGVGFHVLATGQAAVLGSSMDPVSRALKDQQTGFVIGGADLNDLGLMGARLPTGEAGKPLPPGTGYYVRRGRVRKLRAATPVGRPLAEWVRWIAEEVAPGGASGGERAAAAAGGGPGSLPAG